MRHASGQDGYQGPDGPPAPAVEVFPIAIGHYTHFKRLNVDKQVGLLLDLLARYGARHHRWAAPVDDRNLDQATQRLREWTTASDGPNTPINSILYWVGHGWSDGPDAALAVTDSPRRVGRMNGVTPEQLADAIRVRQGSARVRAGWRDGQGWALVVVDACRSQRFVELLAKIMNADPDPAKEVLLIGVSGDGGTDLGRFTNALHDALTVTYMANGRIRLTDLEAQLEHHLPELSKGRQIFRFGDLTDAALVPVPPPVASWMSAPLDAIRPLEDVLEGLSPDERWHFFVKARGAEHGEMAWFFEGRDSERAQIITWLQQAVSGMFVVTGRAGSGKSALLGNILVRSLPDLRDALARRQLVTNLGGDDTPPNAFDAVIHLSGLTLRQAIARVADAAGLGPLPSRRDPDAGIVTDLDWLAGGLAERVTPFTVLVDALDEAVDPLGTAGSLLARIAALPAVRVVVGTRSSTNETPDIPAEDENLLEALTAGFAHNSGARLVRVTRDYESIRRYVARRLRAARDHGAAGVPSETMRIIRDWVDGDIDRVAAIVAGRDREFLFARLAVYELIESPLLLTPRRDMTLHGMLAGTHQDLFDRALRRLHELDDRFPILLRALSLAQGRGLPVADGIWAAISAALAPLPAHGTAIATADTKKPGVGWPKAIHDLLDRAGAYIVVDVPLSDHDATLDDPAVPRDISGNARAGTVFRLAHRTFVEYFAGRDERQAYEDRHRAVAALLDIAIRIAADDSGRMPGYIASHLSGHAADADMWDDLAAQHRVLDRLDPQEVTADALRSLFGRRPMPIPVAGIVGARDALVRSGPADRAGLRHLATSSYSPCQVIDEPISRWGIAAAQTGRVVMHIRLDGHRGTIGHVRKFTLADGRVVLASAGNDGTIRLWNPANAAPIGTPITTHTGTVEDVCCIATPGGRVLLASVAGDGTVQLWDPVAGGAVGPSMETHNGIVNEMCALPGWGEDGCPDTARTFLATAGHDGTLRVWDPLARTEIGRPLVGHDGAVLGVCTVPGWDRDGDPDPTRTFLATVGYDGTLRRWDPVAGAALGKSSVGHDLPVYGVCLLPARQADDSSRSTQTLLATAGADGSLRLWDATTGEPYGVPLTGHLGSVRSVCTLPGWDANGHPNHRRTFLATTGQDGTIRIWDPAAGTPVGQPLTGHIGAAFAVCAVPRESTDSTQTLLATAGHDGTVRIWDPLAVLTAGQPLADHLSAVFGVCALPGWDSDGHPDRTRTLLATTGHDGSIRIWDPATGWPVREPFVAPTALWEICALPELNTESRAKSSTLLAATGRDGTLHLWDPATDTVTQPLTGHDGPAWGVCAVSARDSDDRIRSRILLATTGQDGTLRLWNPVTRTAVGAPLTVGTGPLLGVCAWPADVDADQGVGNLLATAGHDHMLRLWDPAAETEVGEPIAGHTGPLLAVCLLSGSGLDGPSRTQALLATTGDDGTVRISDPVAGVLVGPPLTSRTGSNLRVCALSGWAGNHAPSASTVLATTGYDGILRIWDPVARTARGQILTGHIGSIWGLCTLPSRGIGDEHGASRLLATASDDGTVRLWDPVRQAAVGQPLTNASNNIDTVALDGSGVGCITVAADGIVRVWDPQAATHDTIPAPQRTSTALMTAGRGRAMLLTGDTAGYVHVMARADDMPVMHRNSVRTDDGAVLSLCVLPGDPERVAAAGRSGAITILRRHGERMKIERVLSAAHGTIRALCAVNSPDGARLLLAAGNEGIIQVWDQDTWAPGGPRLAGHEGWVWSLAVVPRHGDAAERLASAGADHTIRLWNLANFQQIGRPLAGHDDQVRSVICATSDDNRTLLVSGGHDGTVRMWQPDSGELIHAISLGIPVHAMLQQRRDGRSRERTSGGVTISVGLRTGVLSLDIHRSYFL